jgi:hypothetical protein
MLLGDLFGMKGGKVDRLAEALEKSEGGEVAAVLAMLEERTGGEAPIKYLYEG